MRFTARMMRDDEDYWRLRAFLREVFLCNDRRELSWQVARLDYWRYFGNEHIEHYPLNEVIGIFEAVDGCIAGFVTPESRANAYLNIHPDYQSEELERAMLDMAERCLVEPDERGRQHLTLWVPANNHQRASVLSERGYYKSDWHEHQYGRSLDVPIPVPQIADGYTIRSLGDMGEVPARAWLSWKVFHPDEPDGNYQGWDWYPAIQRCPLYRRDLDLVAVAPDGELCAFTTVWYDDVTRTGYFEPVGTSSDHQRKGLGKAILNEGLRRLKELGAVHATVAGYSEPAKALYASVMTPYPHILERWERSF